MRSYLEKYQCGRIYVRQGFNLMFVVQLLKVQSDSLLRARTKNLEKC